MRTTDAPDLINVAQAARELHVAPRTMHNWIASGRIRAVKIGEGRTSSYVIERTEIDRIKAAS